VAATGGITGGVTGVTVPELSDFEQLKNRIIVAKIGIRVFILWILGHVISFAIYPLTGFSTAVRGLYKSLTAVENPVSGYLLVSPSVTLTLYINLKL
jgi:hypothetical protein